MATAKQFWNIEKARDEALAKVDAMFKGPRFQSAPQSYAGLGDSIARAGAHRLRWEDR